MAEMRALSDLLSRIKLAFQAGMQFGTDRDLYKVFGYKLTPVYNDFVNRYARQDIAARVIDAPVLATWRGSQSKTQKKNLGPGRGIQVFDNSGSEGKFAKAWNDLVVEKRIYQYLERVDRLAGIGSFSTLLFGFDDPRADLEAPLGRASDLLYMQPYGQGSVNVHEFEPDSSNPRFGLPKIYTLDVINPGEAFKGVTGRSTRSINTIKVHHSRVLHVAEILLENDAFGVSRMLRVYNLLDDLQKVVGGSAETFWLTSNRGMHADVDKDMFLDKDDETALADELEEYQHQLRRWIRTKGVKITNLGSDVANPEGVFSVLIALLAGASGIPVRILLGSERGELASEQDRSNWANRIEERQNDYAEPSILRPTIDILIDSGILPEIQGDLQIMWPDAFAPSPMERAQAMAQKARAATNFSKALESPSQFMSREEARTFLELDPDIPTEVEQEREEREEKEAEKVKAETDAIATQPQQPAQDIPRASGK